MKKSIFLFFAAILCSMSIDAYAATQRYIYVGLSNNYHQWKNSTQWGINHWGGTDGGVVPGSKITDLKTTITYSNCTFHMYRMYVYDDNKNFEFKGSDSWWDCKKEGISISETTKNALLFRDNDGGDGGSPTFYQTNYQEESAVSLSASSNSVSVGEEVTLTPKLTSNAEYNEIKSTTYSVGTGATVSNGKFVATAAGTYTVTATITYNPKKFTGITKKVENVTCEIVVSEVAVPHPVTSVTVAPTSVTIKQGATATLTATVSPSNADDPSITWSSDNTSVATVVNGVVTAVAAGTANITVTTVDGGFTATCAVKVKPLQYTFYAINSAEWPTVAAHYWGGADGGSSWPGANMVKESETINGCNIYSITISSDFVNIMFTNQIDGDKNKKTVDLTTEGNDGKYYDIKGAKWYASLSEVPVSYDYYVIGTINGWTLEDANYGMKDDDKDGVYEKQITLAAGNHVIKVNDGTWSKEWQFSNLTATYVGVTEGTDDQGNNNGNIAIHLDAETTITVKLNPTKNELTLDGLVIDAPVPTYDYYIAGTLAGGWSEKQQGMTKEGDVYKHTFSALAAGSYDFKITDGTWANEWNYNHLAANYVGVEQGKDGEGNPNGNIKIITEEALNITILFNPNALYPISIEGLGAGTPIPVFDYYVVGTFNEWANPDPNNGMTFDGTEYKATVSLKSGDNELKVTNGTWADGTSKGYTDLGASYEEVTSGADGNIKITLATAKDVVVIYNTTTGKITFENLTLYVAPLTYTVTVPAGTEKCYIIGAFAASNWKTFVEMDKVTGEDNKFTITITGAKDTDGYKYTRGEGWEYVEVKENGEGIDNREWTANDVVAKWADIISYVLMGVNGDWTDGIALTQNPNNSSEYMLLNQTITRATDAIKVVTLTNGEASAWCGDVEDGSDATYTTDDRGNIVLEDGIYDFYFKVNDSKIYIDQTAYVRNVTNTYGTICLPYASASTTGATFYRVAGKETGKVYLESVDALEAGVPYIFEKTANQIKVVYTGDKVNAPVNTDANGLYGTFTDNTEVAVGNYILKENKLCQAAATCYVNANRAYLVMSEVPAGAPQQMPGRRYIGMSVQGENEATGVEDLFTTDAPVKVIENGQLIIIRDGVKYNVQGQKL